MDTTTPALVGAPRKGWFRPRGWIGMRSTSAQRISSRTCSTVRAHHRQHGASPEAGVRRVYPQRVFLERRVILEKRFEKRTLFRREGRFCCIHCLLLVGVRRKNR
ncbi:MAG: hypothetical protein ACLT2T_02540 [Bilophila wadsworthia]